MSDEDCQERLFAWSMGLFLLACVFFATPAGPLGIPIAIAGGVCGYLSGVDRKTAGSAKPTIGLFGDHGRGRPYCMRCGTTHEPGKCLPAAGGYQ